MKINVIAVGKVKEKYFADAISEYLKRCQRFADVSVTEVQEAPPTKSREEQIEIESKRLYEAAKGDIILTDVQGKETSSEEFAKLISDMELNSKKEISILIGGSYGHAQSLKDAAQKTVSFGKITLPHVLFRVVLLEQIYRGLSINAHLPYHK